MSEQFEREVIDRLARIEETVSDIKNIDERLTQVEKWINIESGKQAMKYAICGLAGAFAGTSIGAVVAVFIL